MKKILLSILIIFCFAFSFGQGIVPRGGVANTPSDQRLQAAKNLYIPRYADTTHANITSANMTLNNLGIDSCGAIIYTYNIDGFWVRKCFPSKHWEQIQNGGSSSILPTCGLKNGTGLVSYDSLLTFDVTAALYALCCDNITRTTHDTTAILDTNSTDFPRYDWIILDSNGVNVVKGTPSLNPSTPPTDNCQIILALVSINAHDSVPAFITPTNPLIIYDENYTTEWSLDTAIGIVLDTADMSTPVHLTHDIKISSFTVNNNDFYFSTSTPISLNDYTLLKLYARRTTAQTGKITVYWYLDDVQQTVPVTLTLSTLNAYSAYIYPLTSFKIIGSSPTVNRIRIHIEGVSSILYMDWIQLQAGAIISNEAATGIQSVGMNDLDSLLHPTVANASTTPVFSFTKYTVPPYTILINNNNIPDQYHWNKMDLSAPYFGTTRLPIENVQLGTNGNYFGTEGGVNQSLPFDHDTTFVGNWLVRRVDPNSNNDTLYFGYSKRDSALLSSTTYASLNGHDFIINNGVKDLFRVSTDTVLTITQANDVGIDVISNLGNSTIGDVNSGALFTATGNISGEVGFSAIVGGSVINGTSFGDAAIQVTNYVATPTITAVNNAGGEGLSITTFNTTNNSVSPMLSIRRLIDVNSATMPAIGIAASIAYVLPFNNIGVLSEDTAMRLITVATDVTQATRTTQGKINLLFQSAQVTSFTVNGDGSWDIRPITATAASAITPTEGKFVFVNNTNGTFTSIGLWTYENGAWHKD